MTTQQPEALRLAVSSSAMADEGEMIHLLSWYEIRNLLRADAAELRRLHTENTALQQGYAAARLEIESLQSRIKTMAEEHADELMVAHMDGMRAAQPAPQQEAQEPVAWYVTGCGRLLDEDEAKAEARHIGGTARAMPLYTAPQADSVLENAARWTTEQEHAIRQGHEIAASDSYFEARPQIDSNDRRKVFQAGFERGWDAARKQGENHD